MFLATGYCVKTLDEWLYQQKVTEILELISRTNKKN